MNYPISQTEWIRYNGEDIETLKFNGEIVWESWKPWADSAYYIAPQFTYPSSVYVEYDIPQRVRVSKLSCRGECWTHVGYEAPYAQASILGMNDDGIWTVIATGPMNEGQKAEGSSVASYVEHDFNGFCPYRKIRFVCSGNSLRRDVRGMLYGETKEKN